MWKEPCQVSSPKPETQSSPLVNSHDIWTVGTLQPTVQQLHPAVLTCVFCVQAASYLAHSSQEWHAFLYYLSGLAHAHQQVCSILEPHWHGLAHSDHTLLAD